MKIKNKIVDNGNTFGYLIQDGAIEYPIKEAGLWVESIVTELLNSGYELRNLPYDYYTPDNTPISGLPTVELNDLNITDDDQINMEDMLVGRYSEAVMMTKLKVLEADKRAYKKFRKCKILINTREELEDFLKKRKAISNSFDAKFILPLNSFVADEALYTPEEYFEASEEIKDAIAATQKLSYYQFRELVKIFIEMGLKKDYTAKDFADMYMSFGVPGMKVKCTSISSEFSKFTFGSTPDYAAITFKGSKPDTNSYVEDEVLTYLQSDGTWMKNANTGSGEWTPTMSVEDMQLKALELQKLGNYIVPLRVRSRSKIEITTMQCDDAEISYIDNYMVIKGQGTLSSSRTIISVTEPGSSKDLEPAYFNIYKSNLKERIENEVLSRYIGILTTEQSDGSTFKVLQTLGVNIRGALNYILSKDRNAAEFSLNPIDSENHIDISTMTDKQIEEAGGMQPGKFAMETKRFLRDEMPESATYYETIDYIVRSVLDGSLNTDSIRGGIMSDAAAQRSNSYIDYIEIARKYLGLSFERIYNIIKDVTAATPYVEFTGEGLSMRMPIKPINNKALAWKADSNVLKQRQINEASKFCYVTRVISELTTRRTLGRSVAVEMQMIDLADATTNRTIPPIIDKLYNWCIDIIDANYLETDPTNNQLKGYVRGVVIDNLFRIVKTGEFKVPPLFNKPSGDDPIVLDFTAPIVRHPLADEDDSIAGANSRLLIKDALTRVIESTSILSDFTVNASGKFVIYVTNASITSTGVIPRVGFEIPEVALTTCWMNVAGESGKLRLQIMERDKLMPEYLLKIMKSGNYRCLETEYADVHFPVKKSFGSDTIISANSVPGNLYNYMRNAQRELDEQNENDEYNGKFQNPTMPLLLEYPKLADYGFTDMDTEQDGEKVNGKYQYRVVPCGTLTRESALARFPKARELFEISNTNKQLTGEIVKVSILDGLLPEDIMESDVIEALAPIKGEPALYADDNNNTIVFMNGDVINANDIDEAYRKGIYQITRLSGIHYIVGSIKGSYISVEVRR